MTGSSDIPDGFKAAELGGLPKEWDVKKLGDIIDFKLGRTPPRKDLQYWDNGIHPWVSIADMPAFGDITFTKEGVSQLAYDTILEGKMIPKETLFMSFKLTIGRTSILRIDAFHNEAIAAIFPNESEVIRDFLFYYLPTIDYSEYYDTAIKGKTLNKAKIKSLKIPLPPLPEQHAIAATLRTMQEAKEKTDAVIAGTKSLKAAMMKRLFTKHAERFFNLDDWKECRLGDIINLKRGYDLPNVERVFGEYPVISSSGIFSYHKEPKVKGPGVVTGRYGTLGEVFYVEGDYWPLNTTLYVQDFKGNHPRYISYLLQSMSLGEHNFASSVPGVNRNILHQLPVKIPPKTIQEKIADIIYVIDQKLAAEQSRKEALDTLFTSLLHDLMTAKIRVKPA